MPEQRAKVAQEPAYDVVWPLGRVAPQPTKFSRPVTDLSGKTVCFLWDWVFKGDEMFPIIREQLQKKYAGVKFVDHTTFGNIHGPKEAEIIASLPAMLRREGCDVVVSGVGS